MKNLRLRKTVLAFLGTGLVSLFVAQNSFAQISLLATFSKQQPMTWTTQQPMISHTMVNQFVFSDEQKVESKQIWVGNSDLVFHIEARESLKSVQRPLIQIFKQHRDKIKNIAYRMALQILLHNERLAPLKQDLKGLNKLNHSA